MNENIDLTKILKDCPKGWKFYSSVYGEVEFKTIELEQLKPIYNPLIGPSPLFKEDPHPIKFIAQDVKRSVSKAGEHIKGRGECTFFPSKDQRDWSKFTAPWYKKEKFGKKMVKPKFKVGDRIRHKVTNKDDVYEISKVYDDAYGIDGFNWLIYIKYQDLYELVPNKFDPNILQPFDTVLVRNIRSEIWSCGLFSHIDVLDYILKCNVGGVLYVMCIPYNDDTKHLVGTTEEAPEYYRYWED